MAGGWTSVESDTINYYHCFYRYLNTFKSLAVRQSITHIAGPRAAEFMVAHVSLAKNRQAEGNDLVIIATMAWKEALRSMFRNIEVSLCLYP